MLVSVGYPYGLQDSQLRQSFYKGLPAWDANASFAFWLAAMMSETERKFERQDDVMFDSESMSLLYAGNRNKLMVPVGALTPPIYFAQGPMAYNYGALGSMMGHALMHAIDLRGITVETDGRGSYDDTERLLGHYRQRLPCLRRLLDKSKGKEPGSSPDYLDPFADSENLASVMGTRLAYEAFRQETSGYRDPLLPWSDPSRGGYDAEQLFFVAHCAPLCKFREEVEHSSHGMGRDRCLRPLMNMREFSDAFQCPRGSFMNPADKCIIFH
ncbi:hypothetical protein HPB47_025076 [Ixodes persulcatus]|uniref:Uncharacterized protein n=1 Tax=Ixodes persulcatus TaxID=34615 RepID=A0AC60Q4U4_IXOPE|nr:hypothetical protein HPB47_025076 [Ixodes persulcatus]